MATRWDDILAAVQVQTPDPALDLLLNRWLLYQMLAAASGRASAFYQSGGAYGFRDQLQDVMALVHGAPGDRARSISCARPRGSSSRATCSTGGTRPSGAASARGSPTISSGCPTSSLHYVEVTGDAAILDELVPFLEGPALAPEQEDAYFEPAVSQQTATLYEHCVRALDHSLAVGAHGLPLMGTGDWNDGMNRVGAGGQGRERLARLVPAHRALGASRALAERAGRRTRGERWRHARERAEGGAVERDGWDGDWYRRAYFDDGTPLGSAQNDECQIDSIAQSWAVISGGAMPTRAARAMAAVEEQLVRRGDGLVLLFTPPFDRTALEPGYIKGYVPGIRENGGQYTHAATWVVQRLRGPGRRRQGRRAVRHAQSDPPRPGRAPASHRYKVEPYVVAGDVYAAPPHVGRGGWTWYTGSAGWLYRAGVESILGFRLRGSVLHLDPCIPRAWPQLRAHVSLPLGALRDRGRESARRDARRVDRRARRSGDRRRRHRAGGRRYHAPRARRARMTPGAHSGIQCGEPVKRPSTKPIW